MIEENDVQSIGTFTIIKCVTSSHTYKIKHAVCEQVLTVILVRQQLMPGCSFQKGSQEKSERRRVKLPLSIISHVISCYYSVLLMSDPESSSSFCCQIQDACQSK